MDGPRSFYKDRDALEQVVESEKVAFVQAGDPINFHEDYHCKVLHSNYPNFFMLFQYIYFSFSDIFCLERSYAYLYYFYVYEKKFSTYTIYSERNKKDGRNRNHKPSYQETYCI